MTFASPRTRLMVANWKMHKTLAETRQYFHELTARLNTVKGEETSTDVEVVICPPFTALSAYRGIVLDASNEPFALGAQTMHARSSGAFTGEISAPMLLEHGVTYVIIGHSERRQYAGENDASVFEKTVQALNHHLVPIVCIGETADERAADQTKAVLLRQLQPVLKAVRVVAHETVQNQTNQTPSVHTDGTTEAVEVKSRTASKHALQAMDGDVLPLVIAYEPVWAIGTGQAATSEDAAAVATLIRKTVEDELGAAYASHLRILYGGSVNADNIESFLNAPNIDGALVGGASLDVTHWLTMIERARRHGDATQ
ncbi:MAG: triose-phosphate isomerase [Candidatus Carbobacillus sp.]|nr:triose-phosphate isomerase [Candidatus Carbobacillus sp.]